MAKAYSAKEMAQMEADMDEASAMPPLDLPENAIARDPATAAQFLWLLLTRDEQIIARLLATVEALQADRATTREFMADLVAVLVKADETLYWCGCGAQLHGAHHTATCVLTRARAHLERMHG